MSLGKVIVFIGAYNAEKTIARALDSVVNQTYQDWVCLAVDNGSADDTGTIIYDYSLRDDRIVHLALVHNHRATPGQFLKANFKTTTASWYCRLDADDEYDIAFLEKMVAFASENNLDIAACGYDHVDGSTGEKLKRRRLDKNLILQGDGFLDDFIEYRGFTLSLWGKLYSISFNENLSRDIQPPRLSPLVSLVDLADDSIAVLDHFFRRANRAGVFAESLYKYYQYPTSVMHADIDEVFKSYEKLYIVTRRYLEDYGPLRKEHEDFLQAIYLSFVDECFRKLKKSDKSLGKKVVTLLRILGAPNAQAMFSYEADPKFRNLANRETFKREILDWLYAQDGIQQHKARVELIGKCLRGIL